MQATIQKTKKLIKPATKETVKSGNKSNTALLTGVAALASLLLLSSKNEETENPPASDKQDLDGKLDTINKRLAELGDKLDSFMDDAEIINFSESPVFQVESKDKEGNQVIIQYTIEDIPLADLLLVILKLLPTEIRALELLASDYVEEILADRGMHEITKIVNAFTDKHGKVYAATPVQMLFFKESEILINITPELSDSMGFSNYLSFLGAQKTTDDIFASIQVQLAAKRYTVSEYKEALTNILISQLAMYTIYPNTLSFYNIAISLLFLNEPGIAKDYMRLFYKYNNSLSGPELEKSAELATERVSREITAGLLK